LVLFGNGEDLVSLCPSGPGRFVSPRPVFRDPGLRKFRNPHDKTFADRWYDEIDGMISSVQQRTLVVAGSGRVEAGPFSRNLANEKFTYDTTPTTSETNFCVGPSQPIESESPIAGRATYATRHGRRPALRGTARPGFCERFTTWLGPLGQLYATATRLGQRYARQLGQRYTRPAPRNWTDASPHGWPDATPATPHGWADATQNGWHARQHCWPDATQNGWHARQHGWPGATQHGWPDYTPHGWPKAEACGWPDATPQGWPNAEAYCWPDATPHCGWVKASGRASTGGRERNQVDYQACGPIFLIFHPIYLYMIVKTKDWIKLKESVDSELLVFEVDTVRKGCR